ncbi:MAG TPA: hypothetical protein VNL92_05560, partial [Dehalococcoidia bacterium]|nr:hypothetical protein [Dehalococcoidia bacterium]
EVKAFLSTQIWDASHQFEVFRKRALSNGGGLGVQSPGLFARSIVNARDWTEVTVFLHLLRDSFLQTLFAWGERFAHNPAEKAIFAYSLQDVTRHITYGVDHIRFFLHKRPERHREIINYVTLGETAAAAEWEKDVPQNEALAIILGGGKDNIGEGFRLLKQLRRDQIENYMRHARAARIGDRRDSLAKGLAAYFTEAVTA